MDAGKRFEAVEGLDDLREALDADLLTCYFLNPYSEYLWLFHKAGEFKYDCQMHGPLTLQEHYSRIFTPAQLETGNPQDGVIGYFFDIPSELGREITIGQSFTGREEIKHAIRIYFYHAGTGGDPASRAQGETNSSERKPDVVIFLNYRTSRSREELQKAVAESAKTEDLADARKLLSELARQPLLHDVQAWRLRSIVLRIQLQLGEVLGSRAKEQSEGLYQTIVSEAFNHLKPRRGRNVVCSLSEVDPNNRAKLLANHPKTMTDYQVDENGRLVTKGGVIDYVAKTGQVYYIPDVPSYKRLVTKERYSPDARPRYVEGVPASRSEVACPLIVQNRVVGVLNLEADRSGAFGPSEILEFVQYAATAALAVRQAAHWRDIQSVIAQQDSLYRMTSDAQVFESVYQGVNALGYSAEVWDFQKKQWYEAANHEDGPSTPPRPNKGFNAHVHTHGTPLLLADMRMQDTETECDVSEGVLDPTGLFLKWGPPADENLPRPKHPDLSRPFKRGVKRYSSLLFPIFNNWGGGGQTPSVRAVLWATCNRHAISLLPDDAWCLSLICRNASQAIEFLGCEPGSRTSPRVNPSSAP